MASRRMSNDDLGESNCSINHKILLFMQSNSDLRRTLDYKSFIFTIEQPQFAPLYSQTDTFFSSHRLLKVFKPYLTSICANQLLHNTYKILLQSPIFPRTSSLQVISLLFLLPQVRHLPSSTFLQHFTQAKQVNLSLISKTVTFLTKTLPSVTDIMRSKLPHSTQPTKLRSMSQSLLLSFSSHSQICAVSLMRGSQLYFTIVFGLLTTFLRPLQEPLYPLQMQIGKFMSLSISSAVKWLSNWVKPILYLTIGSTISQCEITPFLLKVFLIDFMIPKVLTRRSSSISQIVLSCWQFQDRQAGSQISQRGQMVALLQSNQSSLWLTFGCVSQLLILTKPFPNLQSLFQMSYCLAWFRLIKVAVIMQCPVSSVRMAFAQFLGVGDPKQHMRALVHQSALFLVESP